MMVLKGRVWKFGDNISTDHIIPGRFYHLRSDLGELTKHVFEDVAPGFYKKIQKGDIIVGGYNFGLGVEQGARPPYHQDGRNRRGSGPFFRPYFLQERDQCGACGDHL